jgi:hypothetical protein
MVKVKTQRIKTISEFHRMRGLPKPEHPLISVVDYSKIVRPAEISEVNWVLNFYQLSLKRGIGARLKYGQQEYDFDEGVMFFISPGQVFRIEADATPQADRSGWMLLILLVNCLRRRRISLHWLSELRLIETELNESGPSQLTGRSNLPYFDSLIIV